MGLGLLGVTVPALAKKLLDLIKNFVPHNWKGSHNGAKMDSVTRMDMGAVGTVAWVTANFVENGVTSKIKAQQPATRLGTRDKATIDFNDIEQTGGGFVIGHRTGIGNFTPYERIVAEFKFTDVDGKRQSYRFDGDLL